MTVTIEDLAPGMNTLLRMNIHTYKRERDKWQVMVRSAFGTHKIIGKCEVHIARFYATNPMDLDNLWSTCKIPLDAMVRAGVLPADDPQCVTTLKCEQFKVPTRNREATEITIITSTNTFQKP